LTLINGVEAMKETHHYLVGAVFIYLGLAYVVQAVYHYFFPLKMLIDEIEKEEAEEEEEESTVEEIPMDSYKQQVSEQEEEGGDKEE
ncbi:MAG: hypothetical protein K6B65_00770, partial [Bacilli bacterium]|nr:hypothetical protein [Bacilli bacterium]